MQKKFPEYFEKMQYVMLAVLLLAVLIVPGYGMKKQSARDAVKQSVKAVQPERAGQGAERVQPERADEGSGTGQSGQEKQREGTGKKEKTQEKAAAGGKGTIVLDAGHGGEDPGMIGASGMNEKILNLVYAKKVQALLEAQGYTVVMTRETEDGLYDADQRNKKTQDMQRRVSIIAEKKPLVTVSIHQNSYPDASVSGPQVFYFEHSVEGEKLAKAIQDALNTGLAVTRPRVQKGNTTYYMLKRSESVTVIVECGFLSNPQEEARLQEEDYQNRAAQAICEGVLAYLAQKSGSAGAAGNQPGTA